MGGFLSLDDLKIKVVKKFRNRIEEHRIIFDAYIYFKKKKKRNVYSMLNVIKLKFIPSLPFIGETF